MSAQSAVQLVQMSDEHFGRYAGGSAGVPAAYPSTTPATLPLLSNAWVVASSPTDDWAKAI